MSLLNPEPQGGLDCWPETADSKLSSHTGQDPQVGSLRLCAADSYELHLCKLQQERGSLALCTLTAWQAKCIWPLEREQGLRVKNSVPLPGGPLAQGRRPRQCSDSPAAACFSRGWGLWIRPLRTTAGPPRCFLGARQPGLACTGRCGTSGRGWQLLGYRLWLLPASQCRCRLQL